MTGLSCRMFLLKKQVNTEGREHSHTRLYMQNHMYWCILFISTPAPAVDVYKETRKEEVQLVEKEAKPIIFEEERREMIEASQEVVQPIPIPFKKRDVPSGEECIRRVDIFHFCIE